MPFEARLPRVTSVPPQYAPPSARTPSPAAPEPCISPSPRRVSVGGRLIRLADILISLAAIVFLLPGLLAVALLVKLQDGGPVLFAQTRIGKDMRAFKCMLKSQPEAVGPNQ